MIGQTEEDAKATKAWIPVISRNNPCGNLSGQNR